MRKQKKKKPKSDNIAAKIWSKMLFEEAHRNTFLGGFISPLTNPIRQQDLYAKQDSLQDIGSIGKRYAEIYTAGSDDGVDNPSNSGTINNHFGHGAIFGTGNVYGGSEDSQSKEQSIVESPIQTDELITERQRQTLRLMLENSIPGGYSIQKNTAPPHMDEKEKPKRELFRRIRVK
jgi:hypothetical protein